MRSKSIILLALALGCGLVASIGISQVMERRNQQPVHTGETEVILVAKHDINPNDPITDQTISTEEWPKAKVQPGTVTKLEELENKRARQKIYQGEPILAAKLIDSNEVETAGTSIPRGYRVVAVRVDAVSGGGNLILPGDRVDVLVFLSKNTAHDIHETQTKTILQDIKVFAVDTVIKRTPGEDEQAVAAKTISLLVTPEQAEKVTLASELGTIRLILRYDQDDSTIESRGTSTHDVMGTTRARRTDENTGTQSDPPSASSGGENLISGAKSLIEYINSQREKAKGTSPDSAQLGAPWKMILYKGTTVEEMQIDDNGLPQVIGDSNGSVSNPEATRENDSATNQESIDDPNPNSAPDDEPSIGLPPAGPQE